MSDQRKGGIAWTDQTWNPIRGCSRYSPGCTNCFAERIAARFTRHIDEIPAPRVGQRSDPFYGFAQRIGGEARWTGKVALMGERLADPLSWQQPRRVFVNSMSDLFHEGLTNEEIAAVFGVMAAAPRHTFQVLTKRARRMREWFEWLETDRNPGRYRHPEIIEHAGGVAMASGERRVADRLFKAANEAAGRNVWPLPNVWLGVSVEDQANADARIPDLQAAPAAVRFVSYEPALGPVDFRGWLLRHGPNYHAGGRGCACPRPDWIIVGGESGGREARPFNIQWARQVLSQCRAAGVSPFVKQLGTHPCDTAEPGTITPEEERRWLSEGWCKVYDGDRVFFTRHPRLKDSKGGDPSEWPEDLRVQEFPE